MSSKYTVYGSDKIDRKIESDMALIKERLLKRLGAERLSALILGGGYGRGEGGVLLSKGEERLFNDYDLFVITPNLPGQALKEVNQELVSLSAELTGELSFEVDLSRAVRLRSLSRLPFTLMNYELREGHLVIYGKPSTLSAMPRYEAARLGLVEAVRLLLNRGVGLLLSQNRLEGKSFGTEVSDFVRRNIEKAVMAAGDARLIEEGLFTGSYRARLHRFEQLKGAGELLQPYREAIDYKLRPVEQSGSREELALRMEQLLPHYEELYSHMLGRCLGSAESADPTMVKKGRVEPGSPVQLVKSVLLNLRYPGFTTPWCWRYPRERLYYLLYRFLFNHSLPEAELYKALGCKRGDYGEMRERVIELWKRYN